MERKNRKTGKGLKNQKTLNKKFRNNRNILCSSPVETNYFRLLIEILENQITNMNQSRRSGINRPVYGLIQCLLNLLDGSAGFVS